ncbi:hypothetical protein KAI65_01135 [Candidatus Parcubacteria bacterium]|nr:hypothetical protein [Candidatus Parcubacteria bacterium]
MWEDVSKNLISFFIKNKGNNLGLTIPGNSLEISKGLEMLEYIFKEEENNFFPENFNPRKHSLDVMNKRIGFLVRINAYVIILCSLENIVRKTYENLQVYIKNLGYEKKFVKNRK